MQFSIVNYSQLENRIDAEYFRLQYIKDDKLITLKQWDYLENLCSFNSRYKQPIYDDTANIKIINSQYLRENSINFELAKNGINRIVPYEAILINSTGVGTLGRVNINYLKKPLISIDSHINVIICKTISPYYLMSFLQSRFGQNQIERNISGSSGQIEIYSKDFNKFKIPIFSQTFQSKIESVIKELYIKLNKSKKIVSRSREALIRRVRAFRL